MCPENSGLNQLNSLAKQFFSVATLLCKDLLQRQVNLYAFCYL